MKAVRQIIRQVRPHWVGDGFPVRSLFSYNDDPAALDPFLLLDYVGPWRFEPAEASRGVGEHPHRGFETVTIVHQGELEHRDSTGSRGALGPGDVQWMTAASGLVHEEFHSERFTRDGGVLEMFQLWVNLPAKDKSAPPEYQEITRDRIPIVPLLDGAGSGAGSARVIAGESNGVRGPARTFTPLHLWELELNAGCRTTLPTPEGFTTLLVVRRGRLGLDGGEELGEGELARFDRAGDGVSVEALEECSALLLCGQPIGEPVVGQGPFVMNTRDEIRQAIVDYQSGRMGRLA